ncbi:hypothetical protein SAMN05428981_1149 [Bacillus sp. OV194]|nr:hypothetical protein SAMN05428981_1149 [Bacillus sp. OV194]
MTKISIQPDKLYKMSDDMVKEIMNLEKIMNDLNKKMSDVVNSLSQGPHYSPEYYTAMHGAFMHHAQSKYLVGQLKDEISEAEIYSRNTAEKFEEEDSLFNKLFSWHATLTGLAQARISPAYAALFHLAGLTSFVKEGGKWGVRYNPLVADLLDSLDRSKFRNAARMLLTKPNALWKYKDKSLKELLYKKYTKFFPDDITDFTNGVKKMKDTVAGAEDLKGAWGAVKNGAGDLLHASKGFAKANAVTAVLVTAGSEAVGLGFNIVDNYKKYGNNQAVLERENAKAVGNAVNNTIVVGGASALGGIAGGAVGSVFGPVGTVAGAAIGGYIGSKVGEKIAPFTAGLAEDAALAFKKPINSVINTAGDALKAAGSGLNKVEETAGSLLKSGKDFLSGKLSFSW